MGMEYGLDAVVYDLAQKEDIQTLFEVAQYFQNKKKVVLAARLFVKVISFRFVAIVLFLGGSDFESDRSL